MKRILQLLPGLIALGSAAPNVTDYFTKGMSAISALQDFNFALEFNIYTTGGSQTTI